MNAPCRTASAACASMLLALLALTVVLQGGPGPAVANEESMSIREGVLDEITLKALTLPKDTGVILRRFASDRASLGTAEGGDHERRVDAAMMMKDQAPRILNEAILQSLTMGGTFLFAREGDGAPPEGAIVLEGRFTVIDPGSRAKRWALVGTTGRSRVEVQGVVKDAKGQVLAEFRHMRVSGAGLGGGDYVKFLTDDTKDVGHDVAVFLKRWATGGNLHEKAK